jgi:hypothetical protein
VTSRIKTLVLHAYGAGWKTTVIDTVLEGLAGLDPNAPRPPGSLTRWAVARYWGHRYESLGYVRDWLEALVASPRVDATTCNINNLRTLRHSLARIRDFDLIVAMHSTAGDTMSLLNIIAYRLEKRRAPLAVFIGNEYDLMREKVEFIRQTGTEFVCTQLPRAAGEWVYADCRDATVLCTPHALNPALYYPDPSTARTVDVGFIGARYPAYLGDNNRNLILDGAASRAPLLGMSCDIRLRNEPRDGWARFLRTCRSVVGAESGTFYLERDGRTMEAAKAYWCANPAVTAAEIFERFYRRAENTINGKAVSSRHFEPLGTKTCQILMEGYYNGILCPHEHYFEVKSDLSNLDEALRMSHDPDASHALAERAYAFALMGHTYAHRIDEFLDHVTVKIGRG